MWRFVLGAILWAGCGRLGFDASSGDASGAPDEEGPAEGPQLVAMTGGIEDASGRPTQTHVVYAENARRWWVFYVDDDTTVLRAAHSPDLARWTPVAPAPLTQPLAHGANLSVAYKNIAGHDVVHVALAFLDGRAQHAHVRAVITDGAIAWGAEETVGCIGAFTASENGPVDGPVSVIGHDNRVYDFTSAWNDDNTCVGNSYVGNFDVTSSNAADTGASWSPGWATPNYLRFVPLAITAHWGAPTAGGALTVQPDGDSIEQTRQLFWAQSDGATWTNPTEVFPSALDGDVDVNDWSAVRIADDNYLLVVGEGMQYRAARFDGAAWTPVTPMPARVGRPGSGPVLASDGTRTWMFALDENDVIWRNRHDGAAWAGWTPLALPAARRAWLSGYPQVVDGRIALSWTTDGASGNELWVAGVAAD